MDADDRLAAVLFDMDGTLVDSEKIWDISLKELSHRLGGELSAGARASMVGANLARSIGIVHTDVGVVDGDLERDGAWLLARTRELFSEGLTWRPGAPELLHAVRDAGLPTALVTSTERDLTDVALKWIGAEFFDVTVCGDEVAHNKPHPDPYQRAAKLLGVDPTRCVAIEDSPTGTASAVAAGCTVIVVPAEVPVEPGERRIIRDSLLGVDVPYLRSLL
jgi:HAD superfamily hydrolase (TIGR01509 family)